MAGDDIAIGTVTMDMNYSVAFKSPPGDAYERLLLDGMRGDATLFARRDEVGEAWKYIDPINQAWESGRVATRQYSVGDGPDEARALIEASERRWRELRT